MEKNPFAVQGVVLPAVLNERGANGGRLEPKILMLPQETTLADLQYMLQRAHDRCGYASLEIIPWKNKEDIHTKEDACSGGTTQSSSTGQ